MDSPTGQRLVWLNGLFAAGLSCVRVVSHTPTSFASHDSSTMGSHTEVNTNLRALNCGLVCVVQGTRMVHMKGEPNSVFPRSSPWAPVEGGRLPRTEILIRTLQSWTGSGRELNIRLHLSLSARHQRRLSGLETRYPLQDSSVTNSSHNQHPHSLTVAHTLRLMLYYKSSFRTSAF